MFVIIESGGQVEVCKQLGPYESIELEHHARRYGVTVGYDVETDSRTPAGLGADFDVTISPTKKLGTRVWSSAGFYFKPE